jgi:predicted small secreted protein
MTRLKLTLLLALLVVLPLLLTACGKGGGGY